MSVDTDSTREHPSHVTVSLIDGAFRVLRVIVPWVGIVAVAREIRIAVTGLAGAVTVADIQIGLLADISANIDQYVAYVLGIGGIGYGAFQRHQTGKRVLNLGKRNKELEAMIDAGRTSSNLTGEGRTREEDRL